MRIVYLPSAQQGLEWFARYYGENFPEGAARAATSLAKAEAVLASQPGAGQAITETEGVRRLRIERTPFSLVYRHVADRVEVLRIWDARSRGLAL